MKTSRVNLYIKLKSKTVGIGNWHKYTKYGEVEKHKVRPTKGV